MEKQLQVWALYGKTITGLGPKALTDTTIESTVSRNLLSVSFSFFIVPLFSDDQIGRFLCI